MASGDIAIDGLVRETVEQVEQSNPDADVLLENEVHTDIYRHQKPLGRCLPICSPMR